MAVGTNDYFHRRYWPAWLTLVVGLCATAGLGWKLQHAATELDRQRLALRIKETAGQLEGRLEKTEQLLRSLQDYLTLSGEPRNEVLNEWCRKQGLSFNHPWVHGIAVFTNRYATDWQQSLPSSPATWTEADWAALRALALERPVECGFAMKYLRWANKRFLPDYELNGMEQMTNQFISAIKKDEVRMTRRQTVMLDANGKELTGCFFMIPVYEHAMNELLPRAKRGDEATKFSIRWLHLKAMIVAPIDFTVLEKAVWGKVAPDLGVELFSSNDQTAETWLNNSTNGPRAADSQFKPYLSHRLTWPMYSDRFSIFFFTTPLFEAQSPRKMAWLTFGAGAGMTLLATALLGVALRARIRQERLTDQIREARDALAAAQKERERLSHDLHDNTVQALYAIQLGLGHTVKRLEGEPAQAHRELRAARGELDAVIAELRRFILAEERADTAADLSSVLRALAERAQASTTARLEVDCEPQAADRLGGDQAVQLANIAREALSNSLRHARPSQVQIKLRSEARAVRLEISDDGIGFDPNSKPPGVGLASMAGRAREIGATLDIESAPGQGTRVAVRVPASPLERNGSDRGKADPEVT